MPTSRPKTMVLAAAATSSLLFTGACGTDDADDKAARPDGQGVVTYEPGDYSAEGTYQTPGGRQRVVVDLTLAADGTITAVAVEPQAREGNSQQFQGKFAGGIADTVVGKKIDELQVDKVSGSSLTSGGFHAAIDEIKDQAAV